MLLLYILIIIVVLVIIKYLYLMIKRLCLIREIGRQVKKLSGSMQYCRNPILSVFRHDGKSDLSLHLPNKTIDVSIITTPLRRVRYHFDMNDNVLELIIERRSVYMVNPRVPRPSGVMDRVYTIRKYKLEIAAADNKNQKYVILHPAPKSISKASGSTLSPIYNDDDLIPGIKVCGRKWFFENIVEK